MVDARFRLSPNGLTVTEHFDFVNDGKEYRMPFRVFCTLNPDIPLEEREERVGWLNAGYDFAHPKHSR